ncbi:F-box associated domain type 3 [Arabidopsis suecica]|uniref:F-box associated domain type 3 n=1 Tax=Arabidopsis suecica TaxID=45249 RepID=A0A8T2CER0_ARASU|nr:F-box associated domain type 3 [Arabidopsis suecica]
MNRGGNSDSIPIDLILDILSRLPSKSIARFRCVSKLWGSMLRQPYFTELFLTRSSARPRLLIGIRSPNGEFSFFSTPHPQNPYGKSSLVVTADFHMKFSKDMGPVFSCVTSGLIYFSSMRISKDEDEDKGPVLCNPITGQYAILPYLMRYRKFFSFLGFDPIDKQFKALFIAYPYCSDDHEILTVGTEKMGWRKIHCPLTHHPVSKGICINGVLYYFACGIVRTSDDENYEDVIVCFDVRSEKFKFIDANFFRDRDQVLDITELIWINYKGKLCAISWGILCGNTGGRMLHMWVLEDVEKHEWSKYVYTLLENEVIKHLYDLIVGVTATGEIVFSKKNDTSRPVYVFYFNPERNTLQSIEIQGLEKDRFVYYAIIDLVEDLNINDAKELKSSSVNQGLSIIRKMPTTTTSFVVGSSDLGSQPKFKYKSLAIVAVNFLQVVRAPPLVVPTSTLLGIALRCGPGGLTYRVHVIPSLRAWQWPNGVKSGVSRLQGVDPWPGPTESLLCKWKPLDHHHLVALTLFIRNYHKIS